MTASCCSPPKWAACRFPEEKITHKWRLQPGKMLLIDLEQKRIISDEELKRTLSTQHPYKDWLKRTQVVLRELPAAKTKRPKITVPLLDRQQAFGYTQEDLKLLMAPMAQTGQEAVGSMGNDAPISALSGRPKLLDTYFKQNFAQVTNPPIDPIREELVMSLVSFIGPRPNLLDLKGTSKHMRLEVAQPILTNEELERIRTIGVVKDNPFRTVTIDITYDVANGPEYMEAALDAICAMAERAVRDGYNIIILSDRADIGRARADPVAARHLGDPSSSDPQGLAHLGRPGGRIGRAPRGASILRACRLRRRGDQSLSRLRDARGHAADARGEDHE